MESAERIEDVDFEMRKVVWELKRRFCLNQVKLQEPARILLVELDHTKPNRSGIFSYLRLAA